MKTNFEVHCERCKGEEGPSCSDCCKKCKEAYAAARKAEIISTENGRGWG